MTAESLDLYEAERRVQIPHTSRIVGERYAVLTYDDASLLPEAHNASGFPFNFFYT